MFYIYEHRRLDNNQLFYIGKGKDKRAYSIKGRSPQWQKIYSEAKGRIVNIVFECEDEDTVLAFETFLIKTAVIWGEELTNKTFGGEGKSGIKRTEAQKEHLRQINLGKKHKQSTKDKLRSRSQDSHWANLHLLASNRGSSTLEAKILHKEKQKRQHKPVIGTNVKTGEEIHLDFLSQDKRFSGSLIKKNILGLEGRTHHGGYVWRYATKNDI